ncbi:MAG: 5'-3' exonuclease H3TH domain-containing protein [bacterium]|nr:5'-3' exonuclease H3TH domain-containing protein [bacterium]
MENGEKTTTFVIIDSHSLLHRAYHAFPKTLTTRKGELVNAVYGFTRILLSLIRELRPKYLAAAFDLPGPNFRHREFIGYQAQRPTMDEELKGQIDRVRQMVTALGIPVFAVPGFEADDVIGTLAFQVAGGQKENSDSPRGSNPDLIGDRPSEKITTIIVTGDKDLMQLANERVKIYALGKTMTEGGVFGEKEVEKLLGIPPAQVVDYKGLVGDSSDNYPGVSGIGPKTAVNLLRQFGSLEKIYEAIEQPASSVGGLDNETTSNVADAIGQWSNGTIEKLLKGKEAAFLSQKLAKIETDAPVRCLPKDCEFKVLERPEAIKMWEELGFKSLISAISKKNDNQRDAKKDNPQMALF